MERYFLMKMSYIRHLTEERRVLSSVMSSDNTEHSVGRVALHCLADLVLCGCLPLLCCQAQLTVWMCCTLQFTLIMISRHMGCSGLGSWAWGITASRASLSSRLTGFVIHLGTEFSILCSVVLRGSWEASCWCASIIRCRQTWEHHQLSANVSFLSCEIKLYSITT